MQGPVLLTWRLSHTEGSVQMVQGRVDPGLSQAFYGSLVAGTQQVLTSVPRLCAQGKGRAEQIGKSHLESQEVMQAPKLTLICLLRPHSSCRRPPVIQLGSVSFGA